MDFTLRNFADRNNPPNIARNYLDPNDVFNAAPRHATDADCDAQLFPSPEVQLAGELRDFVDIFLQRYYPAEKIFDGSKDKDDVDSKLASIVDERPDLFDHHDLNSETTLKDVRSWLRRLMYKVQQTRRSQAVIHVSKTPDAVGGRSESVTGGPSATLGSTSAHMQPWNAVPTTKPRSVDEALKTVEILVKIYLGQDETESFRRYLSRLVSSPTGEITEQALDDGAFKKWRRQIDERCRRRANDRAFLGPTIQYIPQQPANTPNGVYDADDWAACLISCAREGSNVATFTATCSLVGKALSSGKNITRLMCLRQIRDLLRRR